MIQPPKLSSARMNGKSSRTIGPPLLLKLHSTAAKHTVCLYSLCFRHCWHSTPHEPAAMSTGKTASEAVAAASRAAKLSGYKVLLLHHRAPDPAHNIRN